MKKILIFLSLIILATAQLSWPVFLTFFNTKPDLLLAFAISLVFYFNIRVALAAAIIAGLLKDAFLPKETAINTLFFAAWSYLAFRLSSQFSTENNYMRLAVILFLCLLNNIALGIQSLNAGNLIPAGIFLRSLVLSSAYTGLVSPLILKLTRKISA